MAEIPTTAERCTQCFAEANGPRASARDVVDNKSVVQMLARSAKLSGEFAKTHAIPLVRLTPKKPPAETTSLGALWQPHLQAPCGMKVPSET